MTATRRQPACEVPQATPLPWTVAGPTGDTRGLERAFLQLLNRRDPSRTWALLADCEPNGGTSERAA